MGVLIDLIGQKFGKLTVIQKDKIKYKDGSAHWLCQCDCGNIKSINGASLRKGHTTSCGCNQSQSSKLNLLGKTFGRLTVLKEVEKPEQVSQKASYWLCKCECGVEKIIRGNLLTSGQINSCGCMRKDSIFKDLTNQRFGLLTVKYPLAEKAKDGGTIWFCSCECGGTTKVSVSNLLHNKVRSCGCSRISFGEREIAELLRQNNINFKREYTFPDLLGDRNCSLRFDFCIFNKDNSINRLIEFQGLQHYKETSFFSSPKKNDEKKKQYCLKNNIILICIPYWIQTKITLDDLFSNKYNIIKEGEDHHWTS